MPLKIISTALNISIWVCTSSPDLGFVITTLLKTNVAGFKILNHLPAQDEIA
jgi:hypothetical protein